MDDGTIVEVGTHLQLLAAEGHYARLVRSQALAGAPIPQPSL
jgi:ATP-binding cassette, subfamily B, bacterial MsbA